MCFSETFNAIVPHKGPSRCSYIVGVDVPGHVAVGHQLTVDVAADLRVPPAVVDVDDADHVPLKETRRQIKTNPCAAVHQTEEREQILQFVLCFLLIEACVTVSK